MTPGSDKPAVHKNENPRLLKKGESHSCIICKAVHFCTWKKMIIIESPNTAAYCQLIEFIVPGNRN